MTTSIRLCLSQERFKLILLHWKLNLSRKLDLVRSGRWYGTCTQKIFYDMTLRNLSEERNAKTLNVSSVIKICFPFLRTIHRSFYFTGLKHLIHFWCIFRNLKERFSLIWPCLNQLVDEFMMVIALIGDTNAHEAGL